MARLTYFDFAENDYQFFMEDCKDGKVANAMTVIAQNTGEKYLKHLIDQFGSEGDSDERTSVMRTHSIRRLLNYLQREMQISIPREVRRKIEMLDGYYFSARYPGDSSFFVTAEEIDSCREGLEACRDFVVGLNKELSQNEGTKDDLGELQRIHDEMLEL